MSIFRDNDILKIILLDTDVIKRLQWNNILQPDEMGVISLLTFFELPEHKRGVYDMFNLKTMLDYVEVIIYEEMTKQDLAKELGEYFNNFPLINNETENRLELLRLKPDLYPEELKRMKSFIDDHKKATSLIWDQILLENRMSEIFIEDVDKEEDKIFLYVVNDYQNEQDKWNRFVFEKFSKLISEFGVLQFKSDCPSSHNLIRIQAFINVLIAKGKKNDDGKIKLKFEDKEHTIPLKPNFFADLKISVAYLPYIARFVTHDKVQHIILKKLFPKYSEKIVLLLQKQRPAVSQNLPVDFESTN